MKYKAVLKCLIALLLFANSSNAQIVFDSTEAYIVNTEMKLLLPSPPNNIFCPRVFYNATNQTIMFEYAETIYKETRFINTSRNIFDTLAKKPYPLKQIIDWGEGQKISLQGKAKLKPADVILLNKIYNRTENVFFCSHQDFNDDGNNEFIVIRKTKEFPTMLPAWRKGNKDTYFILDVFTVRDDVYTKKYHFGYDTDITEICLSHVPHSSILNFLYLEIYNKQNGAFQVGIDSIRL